MEENKNVLDEINKGACMGKDSIHYILDKVENKKLRKERIRLGKTILIIGFNIIRIWNEKHIIARPSF